MKLLLFILISASLGTQVIETINNGGFFTDTYRVNIINPIYYNSTRYLSNITQLSYQVFIPNNYLFQIVNSNTTLYNITCNETCSNTIYNLGTLPIDAVIYSNGYSNVVYNFTVIFDYSVSEFSLWLSILILFGVLVLWFGAVLLVFLLTRSNRN